MGSGEESALPGPNLLAFFPLVLRAGSPLLTERLEQASFFVAWYLVVITLCICWIFSGTRSFLW